MRTYTVQVCWKVEMGDAMEIIAETPEGAARMAVQMTEIGQHHAKVLDNSDGPTFVEQITDDAGKDCPIPTNFTEMAVKSAPRRPEIEIIINNGIVSKVMLNDEEISAVVHDNHIHGCDPDELQCDADGIVRTTYGV